MNKTKKETDKKLPPEELIERLAKRIKKLRLEKGFTSYEAFAYEHNLSRALYGRYEKGKDLRFTSLVKVVQAFDLTLEEFFSEGFE
ncbi:MAG: helix-turn-helix transcriptional regulator [Bacteroidota bacterium]|nr:helix-turn-helix transcriptional regulator [Bacteroidota bacterium]